METDDLDNKGDKDEAVDQICNQSNHLIAGQISHIDEKNKKRPVRENVGGDGTSSISGPLGRYDSLKSLQSNVSKVKYVNLQALIDREIILDHMLQNFTKGVSITELSIELWFLINEIDIARPLDGGNKEAKVEVQNLKTMPDRVKELLKDFDKASLLAPIIPFKHMYEDFLPKDKRFRRQLAISTKL